MTSWPLKTLLRTLFALFNTNSPKVTRTKFLGSNRLRKFIDINKFGRFQRSPATTAILSQLDHTYSISILLLQTKKVISMSNDKNTRK